MSSATRECMPDRRRSYVQKAKIDGHTIYLTCGLYADGRLGEIWVDLAKQGAALRFWAGASATLFSVALQQRTPLETLVSIFLGSKSEPAGAVDGHPRITRCTSVLDYIVRSLAIDFLGREDLADRPAPAPGPEEGGAL